VTLRPARPLLLGILVASFAFSPATALADPAEPTNYQSVVLDVDPRTPGVHFEIVGGDAYLAVSVEPGHAVEVPGYFDEPYIRIETDGTVWVNEQAPAFEINASRFGRFSGDEGNGSDPAWKTVGADGTYAWHDHRTHWMSEDRPPTIDPSVAERIFPWQVPVLVDGVPTVVSGELSWVPSRSPLPTTLVGAVALLPLIWLRRRNAALPQAYAVAAAVLSGVATWLLWLGTPPVGRASPAVPVLVWVALAAALAAIAVRRPTSTRLLAAGAVVCLLPVVVGLASVLVRPVVPSPSPLGLVAAYSLAAWSAVGSLVAAMRPPASV
jgi:hypothetical protein